MGEPNRAVVSKQLLGVVEGRDNIGDKRAFNTAPNQRLPTKGSSTGTLAVLNGGTLPFYFVVGFAIATRFGKVVFAPEIAVTAIQLQIPALGQVVFKLDAQAALLAINRTRYLRVVMGEGGFKTVCPVRLMGFDSEESKSKPPPSRKSSASTLLLTIMTRASSVFFVGVFSIANSS